jgi:hypothetical protein
MLSGSGSSPTSSKRGSGAGGCASLYHTAETLFSSTEGPRGSLGKEKEDKYLLATFIK